MQFIVFLFLILINTYLLRNIMRANNSNIVLYKIYAKNYWNIFILLFSILYFIYNGMEIYEIIENKSIVSYINNLEKFELITFLLWIILVTGLFISSLLLLFMKSIIINDTILLTDGIFRIDTIRKIEKNNKIIKIYLKKSSPYALLGYKTFKVKENEIEDVFNYLNNRINNSEIRVNGI